MTAPPPLPAQVLSRVTRIARFDGWSLVVVAGGFALVSVQQRDLTGALIGALIASAGALELFGLHLLARRRLAGLSLLVGSQLYLLVALLSYCSYRLLHVDLTPFRAIFKEMLKFEAFRLVWQNYEDLGMTKDSFLRPIYTLLYTIVPIVTLVYQGGLALYYQRRRSAIASALSAP